MPVRRVTRRCACRRGRSGTRGGGCRHGRRLGGDRSGLPLSRPLDHRTPRPAVSGFATTSAMIASAVSAGCLAPEIEPDAPAEAVRCGLALRPPRAVCARRSPWVFREPTAPTPSARPRPHRLDDRRLVELRVVRQDRDRVVRTEARWWSKATSGQSLMRRSTSGNRSWVAKAGRASMTTSLVPQRPGDGGASDRAVSVRFRPSPGAAEWETLR